MLAGHGHQEERISPIDPLEADTGAVASRLIAWRLMCTPGDICVGADCLQNALAVLPDKYAGAEGAQLRLLLMHGDAPATAVQGDGGGQAGESRSGNLRMHRGPRTSSGNAGMLSRTEPRNATSKASELGT